MIAIRTRRVLHWFALISSVAVVRLDAAPAETGVDPVDRAAVYRFDPFGRTMIAVDPADVKVGYLYNHFSQTQGRRVWSHAAENGQFVYAMGEGSVQPGHLLDIRAPREQVRDRLAEIAPELVELLELRGGEPFIRLNAAGHWDLVNQPTIASVFDLDTGRRWEWHGSRRVAIMHTFGYEWMLVAGQYVPMTLLYGVGGPACR